MNEMPNEMPTVARRNDSGSTPDRPPTAAQDTLPFDQIPPVAVPYDDEADHPITFSLTARARRVVAPEALPALRVIDDDGALEQPNDTRPARARALHRAGMSIQDIGRQLDVDDLVARAWVGSLAPTLPTGPSRSHRRVPALRAVPAVHRTPADTPNSGSSALHSAPRTAVGTQPFDDGGPVDEVYRAAIDEARWRLTDDSAFALGVGMLAALAATDRFTVTMASDRAAVAGTVMAWLYEHAQVDTGTARVVLRLDGQCAADLERHQWSDKLGVPIERISYTRSGATQPAGTVAFVRIHDPILASRVAGWCDALLDPRDLTVDAAF